MSEEGSILFWFIHQWSVQGASSIHCIYSVINVESNMKRKSLKISL